MTITSQSVIKTGGNFDPNNRYMYFITSNTERMVYGAQVCNNILVAMNEIADSDIAIIRSWIAEGKNVFIDSGVFNLTMEHARKHKVPMNVALAIPPDELDGFHNLFKKYVHIVTKFKDTCWGYIEIDAGGKDQKIKTRNKLESLGLTPIPVYHPLNDGWDYFDYLAERYNRICLGNVVQAEKQVRKRLFATLWQRRKKYPNLWVHLLGVTPSQMLIAYPTDSCDSSSWLHGLRWPQQNEYSLCKSIGSILLNYRYNQKSKPSSPTGNQKATLQAGLLAKAYNDNWSAYLKRLDELGILPY